MPAGRVRPQEREQVGAKQRVRAHQASWGLERDGSESGAREGTTEQRLGEAAAQRFSTGGPGAAIVSPDLVKPGSVPSQG